MKELDWKSNVVWEYRYGPYHPAFKGKDLTPNGKITELAEKDMGDIYPLNR